jgi:phosphatidylglycerophosphate synthase
MHEENTTRRPINARNTKWAEATARNLAKYGIKPNWISILSFVFSCMGAIAFLVIGFIEPRQPAWFFLLAALFIQLRLLCNLFDGMVAVEGGFKTKSGEIFNEMPDRLSDSVTLISAGYAVAAPGAFQNLGWMAAIISLITAYVRALGAACGTKQYFIGPMAKQHRMALLTVACLTSAIVSFSKITFNVMHPTLVIICVGGVITIFRRTRRVVTELESA